MWAVRGTVLGTGMRAVGPTVPGADMRPGMLAISRTLSCAGMRALVVKAALITFACALSGYMRLTGTLRAAFLGIYACASLCIGAVGTAIRRAYVFSGHRILMARAFVLNGALP